LCPFGRLRGIKGVGLGVSVTVPLGLAISCVTFPSISPL